MKFKIECTLGTLAPLATMILIYKGLNNSLNTIIIISLLALGTISSGVAISDVILGKIR